MDVYCLNVTGHDCCITAGLCGCVSYCCSLVVCWTLCGHMVENKAVFSNRCIYECSTSVFNPLK